MWRSVLVIFALTLAGILAQADGRPQRAVSAALVQVQDCFEEKQALSSVQAQEGGTSGEGLTLRGLFATLAIGLLSILFCVPAALIAEFVQRRSSEHYSGTAG